MKKTIILANFGGPRHLQEIQPFLTELLSDKEVVRTQLPQILHNFIFKRVAKKRARRVAKDYELIGGKSPIYEDTEKLRFLIEEKTNHRVLTFHRYLPSTHKFFIDAVNQIQEEEQILVFPLFPQFSYATSGSIALFFKRHLCRHIVNKLRWIKSYAAHFAFVESSVACISEFLKKHEIDEEETLLFFSAHGVPKKFICTGDIYQSECELSYKKIAEAFPKSSSLLAYQSQFGKQIWIKPYTAEVCAGISSHQQKRKNVVFIPISFTSDHVETLFEIEYQYLPVIREQGLNAFRCPALNLRPDWIDGIVKILEEPNVLGNQMLIRHPKEVYCCTRENC